MRKLLHVFFRFLFGLTLIGLGVRLLTEVNRLEPFVSQTIDLVQHKLLAKEYSIAKLKPHSHNIVFAEAFLYIASGLFTISGFSLAKFTGLLAVIIELSFVHNAYFYREPKHVVMASAFTGIFGAILNFN